MDGAAGSGNGGRSGCRRKSAGRTWFPRRPSRPPTLPCSSRRTGRGCQQLPVWRSFGGARRPARALRLLVARCADRPRIGGSGDGARLAAGRAGASRARRAGLAAGAAVGHACGGPPPTAASAAVFKHLFVLGVAGRADPALVAPGVDALDLAAPGACSGTAARRAGCAYPASGGLAPQIGG